jgi:hypothetical protein
MSQDITIAARQGQDSSRQGAGLPEPSGISLPALLVLIRKAREDHREWGDPEIVTRLMVSYPRYGPERLKATLPDVAEAEAFCQHWGKRYDLTWSPADGRFTGVSCDKRRRVFTADSLPGLGAELRADYETPLS